MFSLYKKIKTSEQGSVVIFVAIMLPIFMLCMVLAIDASKGLTAKTRMASVQDAVGLAYSNMTQEMLDANKISRNDYALRFSKLNLSDGFLGADYQVDISNITADTVKTSTKSIKGTGKPYFAAAAGVSQKALGTGGGAKMQLNSSTNTNTAPTLLSLVLDGSGSMGGQPIQDLKTSVANLVNSALQKNSDKDFWISQVVYSTGIDAQRDFSNSYLTVLNWANDIVATGLTCGACGLLQAEAYITAKLLSDVKYASYNKVVVFMTDGQQNVSTESGVSGKKDALSKCTILKNAGYTVFGVSFGSGADKKTVEDCASPGKYYHAATGTELSEIFNTIITKVIRIRIVE